MSLEISAEFTHVAQRALYRESTVKCEGPSEG